MARIRFAAGPALLPALLFLLACEREFPVPQQPDDRVITFGMPETKAGDVFHPGDSFLVWAKTDDGKPFMEAQKVTLTEDGWRNSPLKFWPQDQTLTFYAASPGEPAFFRDDWENGRIGVHAPGDAAANLMCSDLVQGTRGETVRFNFTHILSQVAVRAKLRTPAPPTRSVRIRHISLGPLPTDGEWIRTENRCETGTGQATFRQDLMKTVTGSEGTDLTSFYVFPQDSSATMMEVEWEIVLNATGATAFSRTDQIDLSGKTFSGNTELVLSLSLDGRIGLIDFVDDETKRLCVSAFDSDADGEISYEEAAAVTDLGSVFNGSSIHSFDELKWFTGLTRLPFRAFYECVNLDRITIPDNVVSLGLYAFAGCTSLEQLRLPPGVTELPDGLCHNCIALTDLVHGGRIRRIGDYALAGCSSLESFHIPGDIAEFGEYAFRGSGLRLVNLGGISAPLRVGIFQDCAQLQTVLLRQDLVSIPDLAFQRCTALKNLELPLGLRRIGMRAFESCTALEKIDLPENLEYIYSAAFAGCENVQEIISRPSPAPDADKQAFGWIKENGVSCYAGSAVTEKKKFTRLRLASGYKKEPWTLLTGEAGFTSNLVFRIN